MYWLKQSGPLWRFICGKDSPNAMNKATVAPNICTMLPIGFWSAMPISDPMGD